MTASASTPMIARDRAPLYWGAAATLIAVSAIAAVALPLLTYSLTLAMFGLAHVLSEMRYVHQRFGARVGRRLAWLIGALLVSVVSLRVAGMAGVMPRRLAVEVELGVVAALAAVVLPALSQRGAAPTIAGLALSAALIAGLMISPIHTLLLLAVLHNLTPIGFIAEVTPPARRGRFVALALGIFIGIPLVIALGLPAALLGAVGLVAPDATLLPTGPLASNLSAYLPRAWRSEPWAQHAFSAVVFAQCMHYAAVIHLLPRLLPEEQRAPARSRRAWVAGMIGVGALLFVGFTLDFKQARATYGLAAAVHAWVEIPILMLALLPWLNSGALSSE